MSPVLQSPSKFGADIIVYSGTKHIDGQGRTLGGLLLSSKNFYEEKLKFFYRNTGPTMDPFTAWILLKSLETYPLRVEELCKNASRIAFFLKDHPKIQKTIFRRIKTNVPGSLRIGYRSAKIPARLS